MSWPEDRAQTRRRGVPSLVDRDRSQRTPGRRGHWRRAGDRRLAIAGVVAIAVAVASACLALTAAAPSGSPRKANASTSHLVPLAAAKPAVPKLTVPKPAVAKPTVPKPTVPKPTVAKAGAALGSKLSPLLAHRVTAIGDSLMIDYQGALKHDLPGTVVDAQVGRQWSDALTVVAGLRAHHQLGSRVIIDLGTNGTVTTAQFDQMLTELRGARRIVFVTVHVPEPWEAPDNAVLRAGVAAHRKVTRLADWASLAAKHPGWFYADATHLPIGGLGARALAALVARALRARPARRG